MTYDKIFQLPAGLACLAVLAAAGLLVFGVTRGRKSARGALILLAGAVAALLLTTAGTGVVFVSPEQRGVVISALAPGGYRQAALEPGLHWIIPLAERAMLFDLSRQTYTMSSSSPSTGLGPAGDAIEARTQDGRQIFIDVSVTYSIDPAKVIELFIRWQDRYEDGLVRPLARGITRDTAGQFSAPGLAGSGRAELQNAISQQLAAQLKDNDLVLADFVLLNLRIAKP
jgi:regulator of protease activity HflC (stomatin/prohibitin superfamily)